MANETVTIKATVLSDQAVAGFRQATDAAKAFSREMRTNLAQAEKSAQTLGQGLQNVSRELGAISGLSRYMGPLAIGVLAKKAVEGTINVSKSIVELTRVSKELGMTERDIRAWGFTAERAGISAQSMTENLRKFADTTEGLKYNIGGVRNELIRMGAGPVVRELQRTADQAERVKIAFRFKEILNLDDPSGFKGRIWFDQIGLGREAAALKYEEYIKTQEKVAKRTEKDKTLAEEMQDKLTNLSITWERVSTKMAVSLFPKLKEDLETAKAAMEFGEQFKLKGFPARGDSFTSGRTPGTITPEPNAGTGLDEMNIPRMQHGGISPGGLTMLHANELVVPLGSNNDILENSERTLERTTEEGTFQALIRFASYQRALGAGAGGGGLGSGSVGGGGGGGAGGGGQGPGPSGGGSQPPAGGGMTPEAMGAALQKGRLPMDLQPMTRAEGEPASWGAGFNFGPPKAGQEFPGAGALGVQPQADGDLSKDAFERMFKGSPLAGKYDDVVAAAKRHNIPPATLAGIFAQETGRGTSSALHRKLNPGGISGSGRPWTFKSIEEGIEKSAEVAGGHYNRGGRRIRGMKEYAPTTGATNDPRGQNKGWFGGVEKFAEELRDKDKTGAPKAAEDNRNDQKPPPAQTQTTPQRGGGPSFRRSNNAEVERLVGFDNAIKNMTPEMQARIMSAYRAMPPDVQKSFVMNEGWRSYAHQKHLWDTRRGRGMVARPGHSRHEGGEAIDVDKGPARDWLRKYGHEHGLQPLAGDAPHFQLDRSARRRFADGGERIPMPGQEETAVVGEDYKSKPKIRGFGLAGDGSGIGSDAVIDAANGAGRGQAAVNVTVNGKGDKSKSAPSKPEFAKPQNKQVAQMQMTTEASQAGLAP